MSPPGQTRAEEAGVVQGAPRHSTSGLQGYTVASLPFSGVGLLGPQATQNPVQSRGGFLGR